MALKGEMSRGVWLPCQGDIAITVCFVLCSMNLYLQSSSSSLYNARPSLAEATKGPQQPELVRLGLLFYCEITSLFPGTEFTC